MRFIGLDLGTSFIKGGVLDLDAYTVAHVQRVPFPAPIEGLPPLFCEIDPSAIVAATRELIERLVAQAPDCAGIVVCTQMQSLVLTNEQGEPLSNCISWRDQRTLMPHPSGKGSYYDVLTARISPEERRRMGNELRPGLPICALFWLAEQRRLPSGQVIPAALADFVLANLCHTTPAIEPTNASVHSGYDLETGDWLWPVIARLGLEPLRWPRLCCAGQVVGELAIGSRRIPCYVPVGDQPAALAGALLQPGELSINVATGSQVSLLSSRLQFGNYQTRPFFDGTYLNLITHIPAGRSLDRLVALLGELAEAQGIALGDPWPYIVRAAEEAGQTDLEVDLSFFPGPRGDRGSIANIRESNLTIGHLFRAAFESMAESYHACALRLSPGAQWQRLVFSGGLVQKIDLLRRLISNSFQEQARFGGEYRLCPSTEDALLGLLALALACSGRAGSVAEAISLLSQRYGAQPE